MPPASSYCVAFSGGRDSLALLHALSALRPRLSRPPRAIHVDHRLQAQSGAWAERCRQVCERLGVALRTVAVDARARPGESPSAAARRARYAAFEAHLEEGEVLLLAHHLEDQAETVLLRLLRGAGIHGLAAMPRTRPLGRGRLARPLLDVPRAALEAYLREQGLDWIDDPSNQAPDYDRNYLRLEVIPRLAPRWPAYASTLAAAAGHAEEAAALLDDIAAQDLRECAEQGALRVEVLRRLPGPRRRNLLRYWIRACGFEPPGRARLEAGLAALMEAGQDRQPELAWEGARIRRFQGRLLLERGEPVEPPAARLPWDGERSLEFAGGRLAAEPVVGEGLRASVLAAGVEVGFRRGGERCRPAGRRHRQTLKKLLQEAGVPPWQRPWLPLIFVGDEIAAVAGLWVCEGFQAGPGEPGARLLWAPGEAAHCQESGDSVKVCPRPDPPPDSP